MSHRHPVSDKAESTAAPSQHTLLGFWLAPASGHPTPVIPSPTRPKAPQPHHSTRTRLETQPSPTTPKVPQRHHGTHTRLETQPSPTTPKVPQRHHGTRTRPAPPPPKARRRRRNKQCFRPPTPVLVLVLVLVAMFVAVLRVELWTVEVFSFSIARRCTGRRPSPYACGTYSCSAFLRTCAA